MMNKSRGKLRPFSVTFLATGSVLPRKTYLSENTWIILSHRARDKNKMHTPLPCRTGDRAGRPPQRRLLQGELGLRDDFHGHLGVDIGM